MPALTVAFAQGLDTSRPTAASSNTGFYWFSTDTQILYQSTGSSWTQIAAASASGVGAVADAGSTPSIQAGTDAGKPAAGTAGRLYIATDTTIIYRDSGSAWVEVATAAPTWGMVTGKPSTFAPSAHESSHLAGGSDPLAGVAQTQIDVDATEAATNDSLSGGDLRTNLRRIRYQLAQLGTGAWNTLVAMVQLSPASQQTGTINVSGEVQGSDFKPGGLTGATAVSRYVGATTSGAPASGTFAVGDFVITQAGSIFICTTAGTPGTWTQVSGGGAGSSTLAGDTDVSIASPVGGQVLGYSSALSKWVNQNVAGVAATQTSAKLGANVAMTNANTWYDGPSVALSPGTWFVIAGVNFAPPTGGGTITAKLWDGTTVSDSAFFTDSTGVWGYLTLSGLVTVTSTTTYKVSAASNTVGAAMMAAASDNSAGNNVSWINAIQLSGNPVGQTAPAVRCYNSADISVSNATIQALTFNTNRYDQGTSTAQHSISINTSRLVCQQDGVYQITGMIRFSAGLGGNNRIAILRLNGTTEIARQSVVVSSVQINACVTASYKLTVGDYVELCAYQDSGGALNVEALSQNSPEFMMARIDSGPGAVQPNTKVQLDFSQSSDITSSLGSANTWTDFVPNQTFTVDDVNSVVEISVDTSMAIGTNGARCASRLVIDSAGTPRNKTLGGAVIPNTGYANAFSGAAPVSLTGLSVGSHTVKLQVLSETTQSYVNCRPATYPDLEWCNVRVLERKTTSSPPSSTPAPAVSVYNSAAVSITASTTTPIPMDSVNFDQGTSTPQHSSTNNSRLTCQQAGVYQINGFARWNQAPGGTNETNIALRVNGTTMLATSGSFGGDVREQNVSAAWQLNVGDYVELVAYSVGTGMQIISTGPYALPTLSMARVDSGPGAVQPNTKVQLDSSFSTASDVASGTAITAATWTTVGPTFTFTVDDTNSVVELVAEGNVRVGSTGTATDVGSALLVDGTTRYLLGAADTNAANQFFNTLAGAGPIPLSGLSAGAHTVALQVISSQASSVVYCRTNTYANYEWFHVRVLERKQSSSPPSSTPAPAVRCYNSAAISVPDATSTALTFNTNRLDQGTSTPQHSTSSNTSRLTCQQAGVYHIWGCVQFASNATGGRGIWFRLNGTTDIGDGFYPVTATINPIANESTTYYLNVGDYVEMMVFQNSGGALNVNSVGNFSPEFGWARVDSGGQGFVPIPIVKTANATIAASESMVVAGANSLTLTLPAASSRAPGMPIVVKNDNFTGTTIARNGTDTIDGATTYSLSSAYQSVTLVGDGQSVWRAI